MTRKKVELGSHGEDLAVEYLKNQGYDILERNFRSKSGEIDIVAKDKDTLCFVEVRTRTSLDQGHPFETVSETKRRKLFYTAMGYLNFKMKDVASKARFDVVAVMPAEEEGEYKIELLKNAFEADGYL